MTSLRTRIIAAALLIAWVAVLLLMTLAGGSGSGAGGVNLVPGRTIAAQLLDPTYPLATFNLLGNVIVFAPVGALTALLSRRYHFVAGTLVGVGLSVAIETAQASVGRVVDIDDVVLNGVGAALGAAIIALAMPRHPRV